MHTVTAISLEYGTNNLHIYEIHASHAQDFIVLAGVPIHWSSKLQT
jgi:hypothetical protein